MRISRKKRPDKPLIPRYNYNERIQAPQLRVIDAEGKNIGLLSKEDALRMAQELELDLVEINPKAEPPVAQILDFTHFKYQKEKEMRKQKINSHVSEIKGIRLSMRISPHDMDVRKNQSEKFLERGDKVKLEIILKDRERFKPEIAYETLREFFTLLEKTVPIKYEQPPTRQGNKVTSIIIKK